PTEIVVRFIDTYRVEFGVEPIIRVLATTTAKIALSTYYAHKSRPPSARSTRDRQITRALRRIYEENYSCYGARKLWAEINREGSFGHVARCTVERLMAAEGLRGIRRRKKRPSTRSADAGECPVDLVERDFAVTAPNMLWVADITYIPTAHGWVYAAFVLDGARPLESRHRGFNQEADLSITGQRSSNTAGARYLHQECRRVVL
ncbi:MAG TPA: IS3 family transposase, partial [Corynebacterium sp.]|nr:IS3 family transposase [Corynebacterium sp.]